MMCNGALSVFWLALCLLCMTKLCVVGSNTVYDEKTIIDKIRANPKLGRSLADRFTKEGRIGWKTMKSRYNSKKFTDPVGGDVYKGMLNDVLSRMERAAEIVPSVNQLQDAINGLKERAEPSRQLARDNARTKPLLCAVFLSSGDLETLKENVANSKRADASCDWSVTFFGGDDAVISSFLQEVKAGNYSNVVHATNYTGPRAASGTAYVPKPVFYASLVDITPKYKRVWIMDADISVRAFSFAKLFRVLDCGMMYNDDTHPLGELMRRATFPRGPIISQPVVADNTQFFPSLNAAYWAKAGLGQRASHLAQLVRFTEQQMPIFQADFFEWYVQYVIKPWVPVSLVLEATWGFDTTWCGAAEDYALFHSGETLLGFEYHAKYNHSRPSACAILLGTTPVRHIPKTGSQMGTKHGNALNYATFYFTGHMQKYWVHDRFPQWYIKQRRALPKANWGNLVPRNATDADCIATRSASYFHHNPNKVKVEKSDKGKQSDKKDTDDTQVQVGVLPASEDFKAALKKARLELDQKKNAGEKIGDMDVNTSRTAEKKEKKKRVPRRDKKSKSSDRDKDSAGSPKIDMKAAQSVLANAKASTADAGKEERQGKKEHDMRVRV